MTSEVPAERATQLEVARKIALDQLAVRQRSEQELRTAMARRGVPEDVADEILERFSDVGLVDDASFAASLTASRSGFGLRGKMRIRQELQTKGIERHVADEALAGLSRDDERRAALTLARRKMRSMAALEPAVARRRLYGALARRGFDGGVVASVVDEVMGESEEAGVADDEF
ncbi:MAG TPA: regulatory protein RecX [Arachnia sp.]|nr:regulatory protein RecX [Arachnia sp.]